MLALHGAVNQVHTGLHFGRAALIVFKQQRRVAADLADPRKLREDLDLAFAEALVALLFQKILHPQHLGVVELLLFLPEADDVRLLHLLRKILQHLGLQSAQDKGRHHPFEAE